MAAGQVYHFLHGGKALRPVVTDVGGNHALLIVLHDRGEGLDLPGARVGRVFQAEGQAQGALVELGPEEGFHAGDLGLCRGLVDVLDADRLPQDPVARLVTEIQPGGGALGAHVRKEGAGAAVAGYGGGDALPQEGLLNGVGIVQFLVMHVGVHEARGHQESGSVDHAVGGRCFRPEVGDAAALQPHIERPLRPRDGIQGDPSPHENIQVH